VLACIIGHRSFATYGQAEYNIKIQAEKTSLPCLFGTLFCQNKHRPAASCNKRPMRPRLREHLLWGPPRCCPRGGLRPCRQSLSQLLPSCRHPQQTTAKGVCACAALCLHSIKINRTFICYAGVCNRTFIFTICQLNQVILQSSSKRKKEETPKICKGLSLS
jgi:hypothetical protein